MAAIDDLINQIADTDLRDRIKAEVDKINSQKKFGLVFEDHLPESTPLYDVPIRIGSVVGPKTGYMKDNYVVTTIDGENATCINRTTKEEAVFNIDELVCVAQFGEPIYPYLKPIDSVCNAPDSDLWHTLIEADNYHALQLLEYLYAGKVDCIYIDPPYNTGARDWKYNNDYVDSADQYRHSKWLSMMKKRLLLAKKLLNPKDSVLIVTIDEKEYLHLGCLLEELFPEARMQMISSIINHAGAIRQGEFARTNEMIYFIMLGSATPNKIINNEREKHESIHWDTLRRTDLSSKRGSSKGGIAQFFPIYVDNKTKRINSVGSPLSHSQSIDEVEDIEGCTTVLPIRKDGIEMNWGLTGEIVMQRASKGYISVGKYLPNEPQKYSISYLTSGKIADIDSGKAKVIGYAENGAVIAEYISSREMPPTTQWDFKSHDAYRNGTVIVNNIFTDRRFTFPKSIYAVKDCVEIFLRNKPHALIVDFFAGSGTTLHAVNLLNAEDGGNRRCILVTNNEVSDAEAKSLTKQGYQPGDEEWEKLGIARYVTWPRTVCSIEGHNVKGEPLKGNYLGSDIPMADGFKANAAYFKLGFLDKNFVALGKQFKELLSVFWMKAGAIGKCPVIEGEELPDMLVLPENKFAVLIDETAYKRFVAEIEKHPEIKTIYIVTDSENAYKEMIRCFEDKDTYQLYRDYLDNFRINVVR